MALVGLHQRVLIANRGEIAIRIARAAAALGVESVSVFPPADRLSLHTRSTTMSYELAANGITDPIAAYLDTEALLGAAKATGCDCVHPGYGFVAENAAFAQRCSDEGLTFIGPPPVALHLFGDKVQARALASSLSIPIVEGSPDAVGSVEGAAAAAEIVGYPVMLKASAGGGGRGMRAVARSDEMAEAFDSCRREAEVAFGDGSLFVERLVIRPRHIEVQILADNDGNIVHLHERDCSVQVRNQKVIEIAPAANLDDSIRRAIHTDAVRLAEAAALRNAATVEFLVSPETGEHFFIECNPRIQVEHTVTEQITGVDLVEAQFQLAAGATLASIGLADQDAVPPPRGHAVQARIVVTGPGEIGAYKEPSGVGVRVDAAGYSGYAPPPQFDPLLAKVVGSSSSAGTLASAVDRTIRAIDEFHIEGLPTNLAQARAMLDHDAVRSGDARTSLLADEPHLTAATSDGAVSPTVSFLHDQTSTGAAPGAGAHAAASVVSASGLDVGDGPEGVVCPMDSSVVEVRASEGDTVSTGDTIAVVSAMKMETMVVAPCAGQVAEVQPLAVGDQLGVGQVIATIAPGQGSSPANGARTLDPAETWGPLLDEVEELNRLAHERLAPGSDDPGVVRQRGRGKMTCRERIALLLDDGSFREVGSLAGFASYDEEGAVAAFTPANHVGGWGQIDGRTSVVA
ncbi:MAG: ATP-grasp domain-containing protein, partial [Actinomycetia bacterium]|nr:ATP-grasp domain-containing protein [Actinomycetes bacterium]